MSKKMKKIFGLMLVAMVMLVAACEQNVEIDTPKSEGLSFYAEIAMTRATLEQDDENAKVWNTVWEGTETLYVNDFAFTNTVDEPNKFTCTAEGVTSLVGEGVTIKMTSNSVPERGKGIMIEQTVAAFDPTQTISLVAKNAILRFYYVGIAELTLSENLFIVNGEPSNTIDVTCNGGAWVSVLPGTTSLSFSGLVNNETKSKDSITFEAGKVYNLGMLLDAEINEMFGIVGAHNDWNTENPDALYLIPNTNTYVRYNVTLADGGFKFYGEKTETVTVEHPAVTTGEEGDWSLVPNTNWKVDNARFAIYFFNSTGNTWVSMKDENGDGIYVANTPDGSWTTMIFCRMNPATAENNWSNKWNQTADLTIPTDGTNCYTVKSGTWDKGGGTWSVYTPEVKDAWTEEVEEITQSWIGNGNENTDYLTTWATGWSNNSGANITVSDTSKTYDIYFSKGTDQDWGFEVYYIVLESGSEAPELK